MTRARVAPSPDAKRDALDRLVSEAEAAGYATASVFAVRLAAEEALTNAIQHGHAQIPAEPVEIAWRVGPETIEIEVADRGPGFDPESLPDPTLEENLEKPAGRGIMLIRSYMTHVDFDRGGSVVRMRYEKPAARS